MGASLDSLITIGAESGLDILEAVSRASGVPTRTTLLERKSDPGGPRAGWRIEDPRSRPSMHMRLPTPDAASVYLRHASSHRVGGGNMQHLALRRSGEDGWRVSGVVGSLHGPPFPCRPEPPEELEEGDLIELLGVAVHSTVEDRDGLEWIGIPSGLLATSCFRGRCVDRADRSPERRSPRTLSAVVFSLPPNLEPRRFRTGGCRF